jgi:hypothetical protein
MLSRTTCLAGVESNEKANNPKDDEAKTNEIKLYNMFTERSPLMRIEVEEEKQYHCSDTAGR